MGMMYSPYVFQRVFLSRPAIWASALLCLCLLVSGCAGKQKAPSAQGDARGGSWAFFANNTQRALEHAGPYNANVSFRYKDTAESYRLSAYMWGNSPAGAVYPIRVDLQSFIGSSVAKIREDGRSLMLYDMQNKIVYFGNTSRQALENMGLYLPFSLGDLARLLNGDYTGFFLNERSEDARTPKDVNAQSPNTYYISRGERSGLLTLNENGLPVSWKSSDGYWSMTFEFNDKNLPGPSSVSAESKRGESATITVKTYNRQPIAYSTDQLGLQPPPGLQMRRI